MRLGLSSLTALDRHISVNSHKSFSSPVLRRQTTKIMIVKLVTYIIRLGAPFVAILVIIIMLASQSIKENSFMPIVEIKTSTTDMFAALYSILGNNFDSDSDSSPAGLSTSAILLMTNLTTILMGSLPDHTESTFYRTCFHTTNHYVYINGSNDDDKGGGNAHNDAQLVLPYGYNQGNFNFTNVTVECQDTTLFDYRKILYENGFYYMLSLTEKDPVSDDNYDNYQTIIDSKSDMINRIPGMLIFVCIANFFTLLATVSYYYPKCKYPDRLPVRVMEHGISSWTTIIFIIDAVATISMTRIFIQIKKMARNDFKTFGVKIELCPLWFLFLWLSLTCIFVTMLCWVGPSWCAAPNEDEDEGESDDLLGTHSERDMLSVGSVDPYRGASATDQLGLKSVPRTPVMEKSDYETEFTKTPTIDSIYDDAYRRTNIRSIL